MKHQTPGTMKFKKLQRRLGASRAITAGTLELLWIATQNNAKRGDIGRYSDEEIAIECDWEGDPSTLIAALVDSGWVDRSEEFRLVIHNWKSHAPRYIHAWMKSQETTFAIAENATTVEPTVEATTEATTEPTVEATVEGGIRNVTKRNVTKPNVTKPNQTQSDLKSKSGCEHFAEFWEWVHLKKGKRESAKAYGHAVNRLRFEQPEIDPHDFLLGRMQAFAVSAEAKPSEREPIHPATWLNQGRYDDDPSLWNQRPEIPGKVEIIPL